MKNRDIKLYLAILLLIGLVVVLLVLTLNRNPDIKIQQLNQQIIIMKKQLDALPIPKDGRTPVEGIDYFVRDPVQYPPPKDGQNAVSTNTVKEVPIPGERGLNGYELALQSGFQGTLSQWLESLKVKGDKGDAADELDIDCQNNRIVKRYGNDGFWQSTNIKCEAMDE